MPADRTERILLRLEDAKRRFGPHEAGRTEKAASAAGKVRFRDAKSMIRFHDALLFLRAFPQSAAVARLAERLLATIHSRVGELRAANADMSPFDDESVSGIAGIELIDTFPYEIATWLAKAYPNEVEICWDAEIDTARLANTWPRFMPLLDEDGFVEPDVPYEEWLNSARGKEPALPWLLGRFASLDKTDREKAELYESLRLPLEWNPLSASRTLARRASGARFMHRTPLITRREVSLATELSSPLKMQKLSRRESEEIINMGREILTVRYRGLYGMTFGAPPVYLAEAGRGTQIFIWGLAPARRFPLRSYAAGFTLKNGVPVNYLEAIALADWMEIGFNTFYAFREGETAWIYAQVLRGLLQLLGMSTISVYPYQLGADNEEAIASGAFWFYRKLGFRPGRPELSAIVKREEAKIAANPGYRTPARTLRKLASEHVFYDMDDSRVGDWDRFRIRTLGMAVNRKMSGKDAGAFRAACRQLLAENLNVSVRELSNDERYAFSNFALVLNSAGDVHSWNSSERSLLLEIIRAKMADEEWDYLRLLREHRRLRQIIIRLGSDT